MFNAELVVDLELLLGRLDTFQCIPLQDDGKAALGIRVEFLQRIQTARKAAEQHLLDSARIGNCFPEVMRRLTCRRCVVAGVVRRVDEHALHLAEKLLLQCFQRQQVVAENQPVVEDIFLGDAMLGVIRLLWVFEQDSRLQLEPLFLADPREFKFLFVTHLRINLKA